MNKNPFSIYDFLGYLFPGLSAMLIVIYIIFLGTEASIEEYFSSATFLDIFKKNMDIAWWQSTVIIILLSYISGHIIAYLSSVIVEDFSNRIYNYPSYYLLHTNHFNIKSLKSCESECLKWQKPKFIWKYLRWIANRCYIISYFKENKGKSRKLWCIIEFILIFPVSLFFLTIGAVCGLGQFITRPLDQYIINSVHIKLWKLAETLKLHQPDVNSRQDYHRIVMHYVYLNIPNCQRKIDNYIAIYGFLRACTLKLHQPDVNSRQDYHRIVMHYVYLNIPNCQRKIDNYIAIYGFLRACTLITCLFFDYLFFIQLCTIEEYFNAYSYVAYEINWTAIKILLLLATLCVVLFMGFVKFYRRFTLENYMVLITEKE